MTKASTEERLWELNAELDQQIVERTAELELQSAKPSGNAPTSRRSCSTSQRVS